MKKMIVLLSFLLIFHGISHAQAYSQSGGNITLTGKTYTTSTIDESGVLVTNSGVFTLTNSIVSTTGNSSNVNNSSQYGTNAGVFANTAGVIFLNNGDTIITTGSGANGLFASGAGSSISMTNGRITTSGANAHGVDVTYTGTIILNNVDVTTSGASSSVLATDFGGGTVTVTGGTHISTATIAGSHSAGIYSTGNITVNSASVTSMGDNAAVIDADGIIHLTNTYLSGAMNGLMVHKTVPGSYTAIMTTTGGSITANGGDVLYITGATASINLSGGTTTTSSSGILLDAVSTSVATFNASEEILSGNFVTDNTSSMTLNFATNSHLTGAINSANTCTSVSLSLDSTSIWTVTADSYVPIVLDPGWIIGDSVINIIGNGHNVYYNGTLANTSYLGNMIYKLRNGGLLTCATCSVGINEISTPSAIKCFPNPANEMVNLHTSNSVTSHLVVYNAQGSKIYEGTMANEKRLSTSTWSNGLYIVLIGSEFTKLFVEH